MREAKDGAEAVLGFDAWQPRLVLMDMDMPVMDGYAAMRAIRARPSARDVAIVAVTASVFDEERGAILEAGADAVLRKPCRETEILEEIRSRLGLVYRYGEALVPRVSSLPGDAEARSLPAETAAELRDAARIGDYERLMQMVEQLAAEHAVLGERLRTLLERYDYDGIEALATRPAVAAVATGVRAGPTFEPTLDPIDRAPRRAG